MLLHLLAVLSSVTPPTVVVFGASGAACVAAIAASRSGAARVTMLSQTAHVGGMLTGGLMHTDSANASVVQGITREFFVRTEEQYPGRPTNASYPPGHSPPGWLFESRVAESVLNAMLAEANVSVVRSVGGIVSVARLGGKLTRLDTEFGGTFPGTVFVDASYEGDIVAQVASTTWGRESATQFGEEGAGRQPIVGIGAAVSPYLNESARPYDTPANILPHVSAQAPAGVGDADRWVEPFDFRLCFTDSPGNKINFTRPASYNASEWELWRRLYAKAPPHSLSQAGLACLGPIPNNYSDCGRAACRKCDMLGMNHGTDMTGGSWGYPNGSLAERRAIWRRHIEFTQGLLWFWRSDPAVPSAVREEMRSLGHCSDEYDAEPNPLTGAPAHWPHQLYVREAKRLVGEWVWSEHRPDASKLARSVGVGSYSFDSHYVSRLVQRTGEAAQDRVVKEGRVDLHKQQPAAAVALRGVLMDAPFAMPYDAMLPKRSEVTNVLSPVAVSATHVRYNAVRMEPTWMILGHAAGAAAALAVRDGLGDVHDVDIAALQAELVAQKQMIYPDTPGARVS